jgi:hypothetical protein
VELREVLNFLEKFSGEGLKILSHAFLGGGSGT